MYKSILVPLDGSSRAERILPHVEDLARYLKAQLIFLRVAESDHYSYELNDAFVSLDIELANKNLEEARSYLDGIRGEFRIKGIQARSIVASGPVVKNIIHVAESENVDLIAMASHGHTGLNRVFYGSVAAGVLHSSEKPLLLIRAVG